MRLANVRDGSKAEMAADGRAASRYHALMLDLSCHCGLVRLTIERRPDYIHECNCTLCRKTGALWGYFPSAMVGVQGATSTYRRADKADPGAEIHFCGRCGVTTHFTLTAEIVARFGQDLTGVNMRLADERDLAGIELRYPDGSAWSGAGAFGYVREARIIGEGTTSG